MCFYASLTYKKIVGHKLFGATFRRKDDWDPLFFVSGYDHPRLPVVAANNPNEIRLMQWGLVPHFVKSHQEANKLQNLTLNARAETLMDKPSFQRAFSEGRCIIPVTGFFEWQHVGREKIPYFIHAQNNEPMALAAVCDSWTGYSANEALASFSIVTTEANPLMAEIHNTKKRMPAILTAQAAAEWLNPSLRPAEVLPLLVPAPENALAVHRINPQLMATGANRNTPAIIEPFHPAQGRLFD